MSPFEQQLRSLGKRRIRLPELRDAYFRAHPEALDAPDSRHLLHDALRDLNDGGAVELPATGWDKSGDPPLPNTLQLKNTALKRSPRDAQAWLPKLAFAADERNRSRRMTLEAINAFLITTRGKKLELVPTRERSLHIFGDEKRLDKLLKGKTTLFERRLSLHDLACYPVAPPLPFEVTTRWTRARPILVLENLHSYESFRRWNRKARQYAAVAYGGGNAFRQGAGNLDEIITRTNASGTVYLGDLDPSGTEILIGVNDDRKSTGRSTLVPHRGLYRWLLANGHRRPLDSSATHVVLTKLSTVFPHELVNGLLHLWKTEQRIPQESFGFEQLSGLNESIARADSA